MMIEKHIAVKYFGQSKDDIEGEHLENRKLLQEVVGVENVAGTEIPTV